MGFHPCFLFIGFYFFFLVDHPKLDPITLNYFLVEPDSIGIDFTLMLKKGKLGPTKG
jgi:hypothetical protein